MTRHFQNPGVANNGLTLFALAYLWVYNLPKPFSEPSELRFRLHTTVIHRRKIKREGIKIHGFRYMSLITLL